MSDQHSSSGEHRLRDGYERVLARLKEGAEDLTWDNLQKDLDDAVEFEAELEEYTKDELALLRAWVERDLKDMRRYLAAGGEGVASWLDLGPQSRPIQPSGIPASTVAAPTLASSANLSPVTQSTGIWTLTLFLAAFSISLGTILAPSSS